jgi:hypothetical protein
MTWVSVCCISVAITNTDNWSVLTHIVLVVQISVTFVERHLTHNWIRWNCGNCIDHINIDDENGGSEDQDKNYSPNVVVRVIVDQEDVVQTKKDEDIFCRLNLLLVRDVWKIRWKRACVVHEVQDNQELYQNLLMTDFEVEKTQKDEDIF